MLNDSEMQCMEIWGGRGERRSQLRRPGMDIWVASTATEQADAGGGEIHLFSSCASGRITRMLLADVCGNEAAFTKIVDELKQLMKRNVNAIQQTRLLQHLSDRLKVASQHGGFAATLVGTYFAPTRTLTICNAGYPQPLHLHCGDGQWTSLSQQPRQASKSSESFGLLDPQEYQHFRVELQIGDQVVFCSNSILEGRGADGRTLGPAGLVEQLNGIGPGGGGDLTDRLARQLRWKAGTAPSEEDGTMILFQATDSRVSLRDNLLAPMRLLCSVADKTELN